MEMIEMHRIPLKIVTRLSVIFTVIGLLLVIIGICTGTMIGLIILGAGLVELVGTIILLLCSEDVLIVVVFLKQVVIDIVHIVVNMWTRMIIFTSKQ